MVHYVTVDEAQAQLTTLIDAAVNGETVFITKNSTQVIQLVPVVHPPGRPQFGRGKGLMVMADDFDEPLPDFDAYAITRVW